MDTNTLLICYKYTLSKQFSQIFKHSKMASNYPQEIPTLEPETLDTVEISIRKIFNSLMEKLTQRREQLIQQIHELRKEYHYEERKRIEHLKTYDELIRKKREENAECYSEINQSLISDWKVQKEQYKHPNPISSPPHFDESHLDDLLHQIERFGAVGDTTPPTQYISKVSPIRSIGEKGKGPVELSGPFGVVLDGKGNVYIADTGNQRIQLVSLEGQFIREFGEGELTSPHSIALLGDWLFVSDFSENAILKYKIVNDEFECTNTFELNRPYGIAADSDEVFVAVCNKNKVLVLSLDLKLIRHFGKSKLLQPTAVKVFNDKVFVADNGKSHNVHIFSKLGELLNNIISLRDGTGYIFLCFDTFNNILISDCRGNIIQIYTSEGQLIHSIECQHKPAGIAVTQDNIIISADCTNAKINLY